jgi:hypothetical protein
MLRIEQILYRNVVRFIFKWSLTIERVLNRDALGDRMGGTQLERALDLIDGNLKMNRTEVLEYIDEHPTAVASALKRDGHVSIPTSAGPVTLRLDQVDGWQAD